MALTIVKKDISLNVGQPNNFELICAMQGDNKSFEITATLYDVNKLYTINTNNIKLKGVNPLGSNLYKNVDKHTSNTVTFTLTEDMLAYDGLLKLVLVFTESSTQLTTFPFVIKVINSPGNTSNTDIITVSGLVEEAKKWALLSKSYAVGTNNEIRDGDATNNSKYYYEQIKKLLDSGAIGNGKILYFDTYEEFKQDLIDGKIENETLICIKEGNVDSSDDNDEFIGRLLFTSVASSDIMISDNAKNWKVITGVNNLPAIGSDGYEMIYVDELSILFLANQSETNDSVYCSIHDFNEEGNNVWKIVNPTMNGHFRIAYGNNHFVVVSTNGIVYTISKDDIITHRTEAYSLGGFSENYLASGLSHYMNLLFADGIFVIVNNSGKKSYYSTNCTNWIDISENIQYSLNTFFRKLTYGNNMFINYDNSATGKNKFAFLSKNNLSHGWYYLDNIPSNITNNLAADITDIVFNETTKEFIMPFYCQTQSSGFILFNGESWSVIECNLSKPIINCIILNNKLYGFINSEWVCIPNLNTGEIINYGGIFREDGTQINIKQFDGIDGYALASYSHIISPLWDIDTAETT